MNVNRQKISFLLLGAALLLTGRGFSQPKRFPWPQGKQMALSLSFDDARASQPNRGIPLLDEYGVKATFYLVPGTAKNQLEGWKKAVKNGHEMGNHTLNHPCSGNFTWSRSKAIEEYSLEKMGKELREATQEIEQLLGVRPDVFAYPCGQTYVGRGVNTKSYVPLVAEQFLTGRTWQDEAANSPEYCDFAQLTGVEMDGKDFEQILPLIEQARQEGKWLVLAGHEMNEEGAQTTRLSMLRKLIEYVQKPDSGIWIAPVGEVAKHVQAKREGK